MSALLFLNNKVSFIRLWLAHFSVKHTYIEAVCKIRIQNESYKYVFIFGINLQPTIINSSEESVCTIRLLKKPSIRKSLKPNDIIYNNIMHILCSYVTI